MSNEPSDGVSDVPCRFGCEGAVGIYLVPKGCVCWDDPVQALCQQHALKAQSEGPITLIARPFGVRPSDGGEWNAGVEKCAQWHEEQAEKFKARAVESAELDIPAMNLISDTQDQMGDIHIECADKLRSLKRPPASEQKK